MRAIAAMARNRVIGNGETIPWRIPDEFRWFRSKTYGGVVIMGRRTFLGLPKALDGRVNVVLTRHPEALAADASFRARFGPLVVEGASDGDLVAPADPATPRTEVRIVRDLDGLERTGALARAWLCGGARVYEEFLPRCSELYLSVVEREVEGDTLFPPFEHLFEPRGEVARFPEFHVIRWVRNGSDAP
jgi:dihydrofolate reductase